jgi:hypothetical protein
VFRVDSGPWEIDESKVKLTKRFDITPDVDDRINRWVRESHDRLREIHSVVYCGDFVMVVYEETILNEAEAVVEAAEEIIKQTLEEPEIPDLPREDLNLP